MEWDIGFWYSLSIHPICPSKGAAAETMERISNYFGAWNLLRRQDRSQNNILIHNFVYISIYLLIFSITYLSGQKMLVQYGYFQLLDRNHLENRFWESILNLHSQPPLLNILLGVSLWIRSVTGIQPETFFLVLQFLVGAVAVICFGSLAGLVIKERRISIAVMLLLLFDQMYYVIVLDYFYTVYEFLFLSALGIAAYKFLKDPRTKYYMVICAFVTAMVYTRSLFHFAWAIAILVGLPLLVKLQKRHEAFPGRGILTSFVLTLLVLMAWPLKNYYKFNVFGYSSWQGYNLSRGLPVPLRFSTPIPVGSHMIPYAPDFVPPEYRSIPVLSEPVKSDGVSPNWNYYAIIPYSKELQAESLSLMASDPEAVWEKVTNNYFHAYTVYSGRDSYSGKFDYKVSGTLSPYWMRIYEILVFQYFGDNSLKGPINGFSVLFPLIILLAVWKIIKKWKSDDPEPGTALFLLFSVLWVLSMVLFVDGIEGNRMRFSTTPYILITAGWVISALRDKGEGKKPKTPSVRKAKRNKNRGKR